MSRADSSSVAEVAVATLPVPPTPFVGRAHELADIYRRLRSPTCRLLTLVGPGGSGKSRLALQLAQMIVDIGHTPAHDWQSADAALAAQNQPQFPDGVFFVPLQPVSTTSGIIAAIAEATGFFFYSDTPPLQQLIHYLRTKQMLLVLDNMEHLPEGPAVVSELLAKTTTLKLLVTSQKPLQIQQEWFHSLTGMTLPPTSEPTLQDTLARNPPTSDAVQLFAQSASRALPEFDLEANLPQVERLCRLVDGMPLAIELAAAWLKVLTCQQIADEIERDLAILTTQQPSTPGRHHSMAAVLQGSWELLNAKEQALLMGLAVFRGSFTYEAAMAVTNASLPILAMLVEKALLWAAPGRRYHMHELLRQYAQRQLALNPQLEATTRTQHSRYYLQLLKTHAPMLMSNARHIALVEIGQDIENVRAGWDWATHQGDLDLLGGAVEPLYYFYQIQSRYQKGKEIFAQAWAQLQPWHEVADRRSRAIVPGQILARCAAFCYFLCEYELAEGYLQECLRRPEQLDAQSEIAFALNFLGQLAMWYGDRAQAKQHLYASLAISQALEDKAGAASALEKLANLVHATFGDYAECKELAMQSLALSRALGRSDWVAYALDTLGYATFCLGEYNDAETYYRESLALFEALGDQYGMAMAQGGLGLVFWAMWGGKFVEATAYFQKSLSICRTIGHQGQVSGRLAGLARIANDLHDYAQAQQLAGEGLAIARDLGSPVYLSHILYCLGEAAYGVGDLPTARRYLMEAMQVTSKTGLLAYLAIALYHYATLLLKESTTGTTPERIMALELLASVRSHPAGWHVYRQRAARNYEELAAQLPAELVAEATLRGESQPLEVIVSTILQDAQPAR